MDTSNVECWICGAKMSSQDAERAKTSGPGRDILCVACIERDKLPVDMNIERAAGHIAGSIDEWREDGLNHTQIYARVQNILYRFLKTGDEDRTE